MSLMRSFMAVFFNAVPLTAATGTATSAWLDAEGFNGGQFFISYTGTATVDVTVEVTAVTPVQARNLTRTDWSKVYTVKAAAAADEGFVAAPTIPMDLPFGGLRVIVATDANITNLRVALNRNSGD